MNFSRVIRNIDSLPSGAQYIAHYYCDFIELLALVSNDAVTISSVVERFYDGGGDNEELIGTDSSACEDDNRFSLVDGWFTLLVSRARKFGSNYPFDTGIGVVTLKSELSLKNKEYLFYLLSSLLAYSNVSKDLTSSFERACLVALSGYLPRFSECHLFGKTMINNERYSGTLKSKVDKLARDISKNCVYRDNIFGPKNSGDGGLDVVGWVPFAKDSCFDNIQLYLCQSAAGKNWLDKQDSVSRMKNYINLPCATQNVIFIPYDARDEAGDFTEQGSITADIVFDRIRIMNFTPENMLSSPCFSKVVKIVDQAIEYEESIV